MANAAHVLTVDDQSLNRYVVEQLLSLMDVSMHEAESGADALVYYRAHAANVSLILMDISMPEMDGFETTCRLRELQQELSTHCPIIALTAHAMNGDADRCLNAGMDGYLSKPLHFDTLMSCLKQHAPNLLS